MKKISRIILLVVLGGWSCAARTVAAEDTAKKESSPEIVVTPEVTYVDVSGNKSKFREDTWMKDGLSGGLENFKYRQQVGKDGYFNAEGHAIDNQRDYDVRLELVKPDFGFLRAGFSQYPKYFDNMGAYYAPFARATGPAGSRTAFSLGSYPEMDIGKIYFNAGLTLPNLPKIEFSYEHQYKDGTKDLLEWGSVYGNLPAGPPYPAGANVQKKIYPSVKDIDERVDIFKLGAEHNIGPVNLGDDFYFEKYSNETSRTDAIGYYIADGSLKSGNIKEDYYSDLFSNTFHADHHVNDKVYWSAGHLFTTSDGNSDFSYVYIPGPALTLAAPAAGDYRYSIPTINLRQESQVGNFNVMVGPFADLSAYAGVQVESTDTDASANGNYATAAPTTDWRHLSTALSKKGVEETVGLRYTRIPFTTVFTEAKWDQDTYNQDVHVFPTSVKNWGIDTDAQQQQYTAGITTSPWSRVTLSTQYRHQRNDNVNTPRYGALTDYATFIRDQEFTTDEISTKLTYRPFARWSMALKYQMVSSDIYNTTEPVPTTLSTSVHASSYFANIYSLSTTWTPINRLYLTGLASYQDTRTDAFDNGINAVQPYRGNVYTVMGSAGYAIDNKTDVAAEYSYSRTDNFDNNSSGNANTADYGIPYGVSNQLHSMTFRLTRHINDHVSVGLRYGFYKYNEANTGGINDYTAQLASASCTIRF